MYEVPFSQATAEDRKWRAEDGARILQRHAELIADSAWLEASKAELESQIEESKKALGYAEMAKEKEP